MARRHGFLNSFNQMARAVDQPNRAALRRQLQQARAADRAAKAAERQRIALEKQGVRDYVGGRASWAQIQSRKLDDSVRRLQAILTDALSVEHAIDFESLKEALRLPDFEPGDLAKPVGSPPRVDTYLPPPMSALRRLVPGAKAKFDADVEAARNRHAVDLHAYMDAERTRKQKLADAEQRHQAKIAALKAKNAAQHEEVETLKRDFADGTPDAITEYFELVLESSDDPDTFPGSFRLVYVAESKQLVVQYELPPLTAVPEIASYKYVKARDEVIDVPRPHNQRKALYSSVVAQLALRALHQLFNSDKSAFLETVVLNCHVNEIDKGTGQPIHPCLVTVQATCDVFKKLDLSRVDPIACLKTLNAGVSKSPAELLPVRPVLEFDMVDPRFVEEADVLSTLDQRPNLMELTPTEFESLITNLFQAMGLETRQTQASRDGGVDCVAFDPRPIFGGKVVIQAKRYKNTVGVSAVRDLFGTLQNEGASKGILVTTSGYGKAAFEFAAGKPLELLSGTNLLYLLKEHAKIDAKIVVPDDWKDPTLDVEGV